MNTEDCFIACAFVSLAVQASKEPGLKTGAHHIIIMQMAMTNKCRPISKLL